MSVRMFLEEISIGISRLGKEDCPPQRKWHQSSNLFSAGTEQKGGGRVDSPSLFLSWNVHLLLPSAIETPGSGAFAPHDLYQWIPGFSGL